MSDVGGIRLGEHPIMQHSHQATQAGSFLLWADLLIFTLFPTPHETLGTPTALNFPLRQESLYWLGISALSQASRSDQVMSRFPTRGSPRRSRVATKFVTTLRRASPLHHNSSSPLSDSVDTSYQKFRFFRIMKWRILSTISGLENCPTGPKRRELEGQAGNGHPPESESFSASLQKGTSHGSILPRPCMKLRRLAKMNSRLGKLRAPLFTIPRLISMPYSTEACRLQWRRMTEMKPRETYIKNPFRKKKQREQLENAFKRYQQRVAQSISVPPVITQIVEPESPSMLTAILAPSFDSPSLQGTNIVTGASSDQRVEPADVLSPPLLTSEGTTPADSVHSILTPAPQDVMHLGFMPAEVKEQDVLIVRSERVGARGSSQGTHATRMKRPAPLEFNETEHSISGRASNGPLIPTRQEELAWAQKKPNPVPVHECENRNSSVPTSCLSAVEEEAEPAQEELLKHKTTISEVEDEMKVPRGFICFIKYGLTKSRLSVQSMISASGTIRSRFSSRRSSQQSNVESELPGNTSLLHHPPHMFNQDSPLPANQPPQPVRYEGGRHSTSLFQELRLAGASDNEVAATVKHLLQDLGPANASIVVNARNSRRETPIEVALALGNLPVCKVLLETGADVHARTSNGKSLAEFARKAQSETNNNAHYAAILLCKNEILSHSRSQNHGKSRRVRNTKSNSTPYENSQIAEESAPAQLAQGPNQTMTDVSSAFASTADVIQDEVYPRLFGDTTHHPTLPQAFGGIDPFDPNPASIPMASSAPYFPARESISSQQTPAPDVADLRPLWSPAVFTDSSWEDQAFRSLPTESTQMLQPNTMPWTSSPLVEIPSPAPLGRHLGTPDMSSFAENIFSSSGIGTSEVIADSDSGCYGQLLDGRSVFISSSGNSSSPTRSRSSGQQFSHRNARVIDTGNSVQLQYPMMTQRDSHAPSSLTLMRREPGLRPNIDLYANMANEAVYSNASLQQQQFLDANFAATNHPANVSPTSTTNGFRSNQLVPQASVPLNSTTTILQSNSLMFSPPNQQNVLSDMDLEALSSTLGNPYYVSNWDSFPSDI
jgi:hypothetical protein